MRSDGVPADALARKTTITELVSTWRAAEADIRAAFAAIVAAQTRLSFVFCGGDGSEMRVGACDRGHAGDFDKPDEAVERLRRHAWTVIVQRLELRRMMSNRRYKELCEQLEKEALPDITEESVATFAQRYVDSLVEMHKEAVVECFEYLRPWHGRHKTNSRFEIGPRVVLERRVERRWSGEGYNVKSDRDQEFIALENVFSALDGRGTICKTHYSELANAIKASGPQGVGETPYFRFRCFRNGNLHLAFRRLDLLKRFNQIAGGARLRETESSGDEAITTYR
ncbi:MAG: DUF4942 domain-containing protein [Polyangiaceae bacterium]|nr:DUF4942 domain-containing protein [Polyangiaceae bacterium]